MHGYSWYPQINVNVMYYKPKFIPGIKSYTKGEMEIEDQQDHCSKSVLSKK